MIAFLFAALLQAAGPEKFEAEIRAFEEYDRKNAPPENPVLFVGSSTIRMWKTHERFPKLPVINRGFGGSRVADVLHYADRIVLPYKPRLIVFYAGENDIADGSRTPEGVLKDFQTFHAKVKTPIIAIGIKPSIKREALWPKLKEANALVRQWCPKGVTYAPLEEMLEKEGVPPPAEWFVADGLHLSEKGYARWSEALAPIIEGALK